MLRCICASTWSAQVSSRLMTRFFNAQRSPFRASSSSLSLTRSHGTISGASSLTDVVLIATGCGLAAQAVRQRLRLRSPGKISLSVDSERINGLLWLKKRPFSPRAIRWNKGRRKGCETREGLRPSKVFFMDCLSSLSPSGRYIRKAQLTVHYTGMTS